MLQKRGVRKVRTPRFSDLRVTGFLPVLPDYTFATSINLNSECSLRGEESQRFPALTKHVALTEIAQPHATQTPDFSKPGSGKTRAGPREILRCAQDDEKSIFIGNAAIGCPSTSAEIPPLTSLRSVGRNDTTGLPQKRRVCSAPAAGGDPDPRRSWVIELPPQYPSISWSRATLLPTIKQVSGNPAGYLRCTHSGKGTDDA
jgi:hypothetical protein